MQELKGWISAIVVEFHKAEEEYEWAYIELEAYEKLHDYAVGQGVDLELAKYDDDFDRSQAISEKFEKLKEQHKLPKEVLEVYNHFARTFYKTYED
jgi:hypothetical protein